MSALRASLTALATGLSACGSGRSGDAASLKNPSASAVVPGPCEGARAARARVAGLRAEGRLDRALRVIHKADVDCPAEALSSARDEAEIRAELAPPRDQAFADTPETKAPMRALYRAAAQKEAEGAIEEAYGLYLKAWEAWRPNGQALLQAGLLAKELGRAADAQRLFDRGIAELEATAGPVRLDATNGFDEEVLSVAWSTGGRIAVAAGAHVSILAQSSLREVARLDTRSAEGAPASVESVAFSPDGTRVAWGGMDGAGVFDVASGAPVWRSGALVPVRSVKTLAYSPDGARIAVSLYERVALLDAGTGVELLTLPAQSANAASVAFAPDGATLATTSKTGDALLFHTSDGKLARTIPVTSSTDRAGSRALRQIVFTPDGRSLVCACADDTVRVVDVATSRETHRAAVARGVTRLRSIAVSPDGGTIAWSAQGDDDAVELWSRADGARTRVLGFESDGMTFGGPITFSPDGRVVLASEMNGVYASDARTGAAIRRATQHAYVVDTVEFGAKGSLAVDSRGLRIIELPSGEISSDLDARSFALSPTGERVIVSRRSSSPLALLDMSTLKEISRTPDVPFASRLAFSGDRALVAGAAPGVGIWFWDPRDGGHTPTFGRDEKDVDAIAFSPDGLRFAATLDDEDLLRVWTVQSGALLTIPGAEDAHDVAFSPDSSRLATAGDDVKLFDAKTGAEVAVLGEEKSFSIAFSRGGSWIAAGRGSGEVDVWDARTLALVKTLPAGTAIIAGVAFSADERLLASGSFDGTTTLWRAPSFEHVAGIRAIDGANAGYVLSPDGRIDFVGAAKEVARGFPLCRIGPHAFAFEVCAERFEVPRLLERLLARDASYADP